MANLANIHPGEILLEEFLRPMDISQNDNQAVYCQRRQVEGLGLPLIKCVRKNIDTARTGWRAKSVYQS